MRASHLVLALSATLVACSSSYHPEYHPVTVSNVSQTLVYPVSAGGDARQPIVVTVSPPPALPTPPPPPEPPPPGMFESP